MSNYKNNNKKGLFNSASYSSKTFNEQDNKSPVEYDENIIIGTTPGISTRFFQLLEIWQFHKENNLVK